MKKIIIINIIPLLILIGCSKKENQNLSYDTDFNAVIVTADILSKTKVNTEDTGDMFVDGDRFVVENLSSNIQTGCTSAIYEYNAEWTICGDQYIVWEQGKNDFHAWMPVEAAFDSFMLPIDQSSVDKLRSADWMTAEAIGIVKPTDRVLNLEFSHKLAKVVVNITDYEAPYSPTMVIKGADFYLSTKRTTSEVVVENKASEIAGYVCEKSVTAVLLPGTYEFGEQFMSINIDSENLVVTVPENGITLSSGNEYIFDLTLTQNRPQITSVIINDWFESRIVDVIADEKDESGERAYDDWIGIELSSYTYSGSCNITTTWIGFNVESISYACVEPSLVKDIADDQLYDFLSQQTEEKNSIYELPEDYLKELNSKGQFSLTLNSIRDIKPETEYEIISFATNTIGKKSILRVKIITQKKPSSHPDLQKWLGEWEVTSDYGVRFFLNAEKNNELYYEMPKDDSVFTYTIKVEEDPLYTNYALIYGLSDSDPDQPLTAVFDTSTVAIDFETGEPTGEKKPRQLILAGNNAVERDDRGNYVTWIIMASYVDVEDGKEKVRSIPLNWGTTPAFIMEMKEDGSVFSTPYPMGASTEDGKTFDLNILSIGLLLETPSGDMDIITAVDKEDTFHYGGNFIWTR